MSVISSFGLGGVADKLSDALCVDFADLTEKIGCTSKQFTLHKHEYYQYGATLIHETYFLAV